MSKSRCVYFLIVLLLVYHATPAAAQDAPPQTLFTNVNVFDGLSDQLLMGQDVLVEGNLIKEVGAGLSADGATVIDGGGRTLMPGLIDSHVHLTHMLIPGGLLAWEAATWEEIGAITAAAAREMLMSGFTTVRDMGGMSTGFKKIIDRGDLMGPRIYAAGAYISQTSGHGHLTLASQTLGKTGAVSNLERLGIIALADGVPQVQAAVRKNFAGGSAYAKLMAGGGVSSAVDPLHTLQYTSEEIAAAVKEAEHWDTYIAVHIYSAEGTKRALNLGVRCIDHGQFMDDEGMKLLNEKDAFLSTNLVGMSMEIFDHPIYGDPSGPQYAKAKLFPDQRDAFVALAKKHEPKMVYNTDCVLSDLPSSRKIRDNNMYLHGEWFGNFAALKAMTSVGGELCRETGKHNPYPGTLGVIEAGAFADILLVDGNPLEDLSCLGAVPKIYDDTPARGESVETIHLIMKDGKVYKDTL